MLKRIVSLTCALACVSYPVFCAAEDKAAAGGSPESEDSVLAEIYDPLEPLNRGIFWFNDKMDRYLLQPIAEGYDTITPDPVQDCVRNFFLNLRYPIYLVGDILRLDFSDAATHTGRFLVNSTVGVAGLFDVAEDWGLEEKYLDTGMALQSDGVGPGFYIVIPFLGPSTLRDGTGKIIDAFLHPGSYPYYLNMKAGEADKISYGSRAMELLQDRADALDAVDAGRESAVDLYLFTQSAYYQYRAGKVKKLEKGNSREISDSEFNDE